jgi:hypothetical protein
MLDIKGASTTSKPVADLSPVGESKPFMSLRLEAGRNNSDRMTRPQSFRKSLNQAAQIGLDLLKPIGNSRLNCLRPPRTKVLTNSGLPCVGAQQMPTGVVAEHRDFKQLEELGKALKAPKVLGIAIAPRSRDIAEAAILAISEWSKNPRFETFGDLGWQLLLNMDEVIELESDETQKKFLRVLTRGAVEDIIVAMAKLAGRDTGLDNYIRGLPLVQRDPLKSFIDMAEEKEMISLMSVLKL